MINTHVSSEAAPTSSDVRVVETLASKDAVVSDVPPYSSCWRSLTTIVPFAGSSSVPTALGMREGPWTRECCSYLWGWSVFPGAPTDWDFAFGCRGQRFYIVHAGSHSPFPHGCCSPIWGTQNPSPPSVNHNPHFCGADGAFKANLTKS